MFVDMHHHFIYGIDDGARNLEDMRGMLTAASEGGAEAIVATPHVTPGREPFQAERFLQHMEEARQICREGSLGLELYTGCEILYTDDTARLLDSGDIPTLADTRYVLVEFLPDAPYDLLKSAARRLGSVGYQAIFAHIERYACLRRPAHMQELHEDYQVVMQVNAATVVNAGFFDRRWLARTMRMGCVDLISSDAHNVNTRRFRMRECYEILQKEYGEDMALALCRDNANEILGRE